VSRSHALVVPVSLWMRTPVSVVRSACRLSSRRVWISRAAVQELYLFTADAAGYAQSGQARGVVGLIVAVGDKQHGAAGPHRLGGGADAALVRDHAGTREESGERGMRRVNLNDPIYGRKVRVRKESIVTIRGSQVTINQDKA
jgi:hypothetical protein